MVIMKIFCNGESIMQGKEITDSIEHWSCFFRKL